MSIRTRSRSLKNVADAKFEKTSLSADAFQRCLIEHGVHSELTVENAPHVRNLVLAFYSTQCYNLDSEN